MVQNTADKYSLVVCCYSVDRTVHVPFPALPLGSILPERYSHFRGNTEIGQSQFTVHEITFLESWKSDRNMKDQENQYLLY